MSTFKGIDAYEVFALSVRKKYRYVHDAEVDQFLSDVRATSADKATTLNEGEFLYRAQRGCIENPRMPPPSWISPSLLPSGSGIMPPPPPIKDWMVEMAPIREPHAPDRMRPRKHLATEGRINPKGIGYVYLATDEETAMSEMRPWNERSSPLGPSESRET